MKAGRFISNYVKSKDVKEPIKVTISSVEVETFKNPEKGTEKDSLVIYFKELEQGVVTCKSSVSELVEILGTEETDDWVGKEVVLFNDTNVLFKGKRVGGLRFRKV